MVLLSFGSVFFGLFQIKHFEKVLFSLEQCDISMGILASQYILLLWMIILCNNPFDLNKFGMKKGRTVVERIIATTLPFLYSSSEKFQRVAALLLSLVATREDACREHLKKLVDRCVSTIEMCGDKWSGDNKLVGSLCLLASILKKGKREDLSVIARSVSKIMHHFSDLGNTDFTVKKFAVKVAQRLGMVFLKPKIAKWRYDRGNRCLDFMNACSNKRQESIFLESEDFSDEVYEVPHGELEAVLDTILRALRDRYTDIRWTGAKGVGRIVSRLRKSHANDVLSNIFKFNFDSLAGNAAWHGGCLAVAELARRGFLPLEKLPDVLGIVKNALVFEEPQGHHALGANVRDAACFICWSLARAFRPLDLKIYIEQIASSLVCAALFDREINVRRAASAAFQEHVGRQGGFPNGVDVLTNIDYFAVGQRSKAYLEISCRIAKYPLYTQAIIEHLTFHKITHWDEEIRILAAEALHRLCASNPSFVSTHIVKNLMPLISNDSLIIQQGGIVALASVLSGLKECKCILGKDIYETAAKIPNLIYPICEKRVRSLGSRLMRRAMNVFIKLLSSVIPRELVVIDDWLRCLELNFCDEHEDIRKGACQAGSAFFKVCTDNSSANLLMLRIRQVYLPQITVTNVESTREGIAALLSVLPNQILLLTTQFCPLAVEIIRTLIIIVNQRSSLDVTWAYGRRSCVEAITHIVESVGFELLGNPSEVLDCLVNSLNDYSMDKRGDVGRVLREEAMKALAVVLPMMQKYSVDHDRISEAICKIIQQSTEKIDATRECAALVMKKLLQSSLRDIKEEQILKETYVDGNSVVEWRLPSCFQRLALLLKTNCYRYHALRGFVISAGGLTESTVRGASDALLSVIFDIRHSQQDIEIFLQCFASIFINNAGVVRVIQPLLHTLEQILSAQLLECYEADPDLSPSLQTIVDHIAVEALGKGGIQKVRSCIAVSCHFLHFNSASLLWRKSALLVVRTLKSRYPTLRRYAAEQLYECLVSECDISDEAEKDKREKLLKLLSETKWQICDDQYFVEVSNLVSDMLSIAAT
ncbi:unnamed protein product [Thelazia callipaeda]|uniref:Tubulin-specific chaperone D n=1 Tax=Thelazia callipaeda TaxID=103827 RepID=A0A3P7K336_THECL|nr:unnamed protein product [Thelazia callipaeda]